jgi:tetratricopeptide (TPR) repeat protein
LLAERPDWAAGWHALALATAHDAGQASLFAHAATLDPHYGDDLVRRLGEYRARWKEVDLASLLGLRREVGALRDTPERQAIAWTALGLLCASFGRLADAIACDEESLSRGTGHPDLALQIGQMQLAAGQLKAALHWLTRAAADDETRVAAWYGLSRCALARGALDEAWQWGRQAHAAAPAWDELNEWLVGIAAQVGTARARAGVGWSPAARSSVG